MGLNGLTCPERGRGELTRRRQGAPKGDRLSPEPRRAHPCVTFVFAGETPTVRSGLPASEEPRVVAASTLASLSQQLQETGPFPAPGSPPGLRAFAHLSDQVGTLGRSRPACSLGAAGVHRLSHRHCRNALRPLCPQAALLPTDAGLQPRRRERDELERSQVVGAHSYLTRRERLPSCW